MSVGILSAKRGIKQTVCFIPLCRRLTPQKACAKVRPTMIWRVDVATKEGLVDPTSRGAQAGLAEFGVAGIASVRAFQVYLLDGDLDRAAAEHIAEELLHDP